MHRHKPANTLSPGDAGHPRGCRQVYNLRLPEPYLLKLKLHRRTFPLASMQQFCLSLLLPAIDAKDRGMIHPPQR
ncbi:MAG: hypothetical protein IPL59_17410 [Candidatus Competibacteraceae bacterium]|nr:hypothetical protein [Candidatus Competibacteraceae bacterium]